MRYIAKAIIILSPFFFFYPPVPIPLKFAMVKVLKPLDTLENRRLHSEDLLTRISLKVPLAFLTNHCSIECITSKTQPTIV